MAVVVTVLLVVVFAWLLVSNFSAGLSGWSGCEYGLGNCGCDMVTVGVAVVVTVVLVVVFVLAACLGLSAGLSGWSGCEYGLGSCGCEC